MGEKLRDKLIRGERITCEEALLLYRDASSDTLRQYSQIVRDRYHSKNSATYLVMQIINYTNVCVASCDYCAFYRLPKSPEAYTSSKDAICSQIESFIECGGDLVGFNGGFNPKLRLDWYLDLFAEIRRRFGDKIEFYALTIAELMYVARLSKLSDFETARRLLAAGVTWITGGGAEILTNDFRQRHSPLKYTADEFMAAHADVINAGLKSTATMVIGFDETLEERIEHLKRVRDLQDRIGGIYSFLSWTYKPYDTALGGAEVASEDYLRHLAVSRIFLDNIKHIRTSVLTQNENALRGLLYGADDFDVPLADEVTEKAGAVINRDIEQVLSAARELGFVVTKRDWSKFGAS